VRSLLMTVLLLFVSSGLSATELWRWVDERGVVHYSDRPHPGAERIELGATQTYTAPELPPPRPREPEPEPPREAAPSYSRLSILSPTEGETLWNIGAELDVQLALQPPLAEGHELHLYLDGKRVVGLPRGPTQFTIDEVFRGERTLRAAIVDSRGRELVSSRTVTFYVQQTSILNPNHPRHRPGGG
jgi:hypothetical protein